IAVPSNMVETAPLEVILRIILLSNAAPESSVATIILPELSSVILISCKRLGDGVGSLKNSVIEVPPGVILNKESLALSPTMIFPAKSTAIAIGFWRGGPLNKVEIFPAGVTLRILGPVHGSGTTKLPKISIAISWIPLLAMVAMVF